MKGRKQVLLGALAVFAVTAAVFLPVLRGEFLNWDDQALFVENPFFRGFSAATCRWMTTTFYYGHWQPISWFSYALDYLLWGMNPHGWHVANWLLHSVNSALVFLLCVRFLKKSLSGGGLVAAGVAALFYGIHPLRVEPAAWLATRGYLLGGTFCLLTVLCYLRAVDRKRYPVAALVFYALAALTKGICMMLPVVLLLLDWACLKRVRSFREIAVLTIEKIPFFAFSILTGVMAFLAKRSAGGMVDIEQYGLRDRLVQAVCSVWFYVFKSLSPQNLSPLYEKLPGPGEILVSFALTAFVLALLVFFRRRMMPVFVAIAASLIMIFPMIGMTQSGAQLYADRFTYLAAIPFSVVLAVGLVNFVRLRRVVFLSLFFMVCLFAGQAFVWCGSWQNSLALWESALAVNSDSSQAYNGAGRVLQQKGEYDRAVLYFSKAIELNPGCVEAWHNRSLVWMITGQYERALQGWDRALSLLEGAGERRGRMLRLRGWVHEQCGDIDLALNDYSSVINDQRMESVLRAGVLLLRARLYVGNDQVDLARKDLERLLSFPDEGLQREAGALMDAIECGHEKSPD